MCVSRPAPFKQSVEAILDAAMASSLLCLGALKLGAQSEAARCLKLEGVQRNAGSAQPSGNAFGSRGHGHELLVAFALDNASPRCGSGIWRLPASGPSGRSFALPARAVTDQVEPPSLRMTGSADSICSDTNLEVS